jgi:hypothetical protein
MKFWHSNRLDQEAEYEPRDVAARFIAACRDGYDLSVCRPSVEFAFRWWLTDSKEFNATWDEADFDSLWDGLQAEITEDDHAFIWDGLMEPHRKREARAAN